MLVLLIGILRRKAEIVLNFLVRMVVGMVGVYVVNLILAQKGIDLAVGLNAVSALTLGSLGFGGFLLLYGVLFLNLL
ncbi:MAG: pro-sigmaK processing inhibitor BofA family protein [Eubacterium sp.]|nr:pro-sigmaK processing inhibitor BofA family protein [Eubacterium sp.]